MESQINVTLSVVISAVGILGSCLAAYVVLRVGVAEGKRDILHLGEQHEKIDRRLTNHVESPAHPTRDQIANMRSEIDMMRAQLNETTRRIEAKVDRLIDHMNTRIER